MAEIPKIVVQRLRAAPQPEVHPDANLIVAFAENSLQDDERERVLAHLTACADCREVAALSRLQLPGTVPAGAGSRAPWLSWPVLRWGAAVACIVVVGAAVGLHYRAQPTRKAEIAARSDASVPEFKVAAPEPAVTAKLETDNKVPSSAAPQAKLDADTRRMVPALPSQAAPMTPTVSENNPAVPEVRRLIDKGHRDEERPGEGAKTEMATAESKLAAPAAAGTTTASVPDSRNQMAEFVPGRAKDSLRESQPAAGIAGGDAVFAKKAAGAMVSTRRGPLPLAAGIVPRWTLSAEGSLQRSLDSGRTWETMGFPKPVIFRALAASGLEIWVGGAQGVLYHSTDAGQRWTLVRPVANGQRLASDIIRLEFTDGLHGTVDTADQQTWVTQDGGQNWQRQ